MATKLDEVMAELLGDVQGVHAAIKGLPDALALPVGTIKKLMQDLEIKTATANAAAVRAGAGQLNVYTDKALEKLQTVTREATHGLSVAHERIAQEEKMALKKRGVWYVQAAIITAIITVVVFMMGAATGAYLFKSFIDSVPITKPMPAAPVKKLR